MIKLEVKLACDVLKKEYKWLNRDYFKNEVLYIKTSPNYNCVGKNGVFCSIDGNEPFFELPMIALKMEHVGQDFGIFITERGKGYSKIFCKEMPLDRMEILDKIQKVVDVSENDKVLKITITETDFRLETIRMKEIEPLF